MRLIIISAPSGAGKTTICQKLFHDYKDQIELSISTTTRPPRSGEKDGINYHFIENEKFRSMIDDSQFAEHALVHGHYYGTSKSVIEEAFGRGKNVLLDIDVQGADSLKKSYPGKCITIFIVPPSMEILETRLRGRGTESEARIQERIRNAKAEMKRAKDFDHVIENDDFERAYSEIQGLLSLT